MTNDLKGYQQNDTNLRKDLKGYTISIYAIFE